MIRLDIACIAALVLLVSSGQSIASDPVIVAHPALQARLLPLADAPEADWVKLPKKFLKTRRVSIPLPGLVLFFNETGCITAAVAENQLDQVDASCLRGANLPKRADFTEIPLGTGASAGSILLLSPLWDVEQIKILWKGRDADWDEKRAALSALEQRLRTQYPKYELTPVNVPF